jgi:hypothetical protein
LTSHFIDWLDTNGYKNYNFDRPDILDGAYGGKASKTDITVKQPVIFIHGNSDIGAG